MFLKDGLKQRQIGTFVGLLKIIIGGLSPYISWLSFALVGVMSFYTTINPLLAAYGITLPFWAFCLILFLIIAAAGMVEWVFMMPSYFKASNHQAWDAGGPLQENIAHMQEELDTIKALLKAQNIKVQNNEAQNSEMQNKEGEKDE